MINNNVKIISAEQAASLLKDGYFALDTHCHSSFSYDVPDVKETRPESVFKIQSKMGLRHALTDHDTLNGYNYMRKKGFRVMPAVEITIKPIIAKKIDTTRPVQTMHVNVFGLSNNDLESLKEFSAKGNLDDFIKYLKDNDLDWSYNHPFWHDNHERLNWRVVPGLVKNYFDVVELNATFTKPMNDLVLELSNKLKKGISAGSDSHTGNPGKAFVLAEGKNFKDFWQNVKEGDMYIYRTDLGVRSLIHESSLIINQAFSANIRPTSDRRYVPATDFGPFNRLAASVTSGRLKNKMITKRIIRMGLSGLTYSAGPILAWKLHLRKENNKAQSIGKRINSITNKLLGNRAGSKHK